MLLTIQGVSLAIQGVDKILRILISLYIVKTAYIDV